MDIILKGWRVWRGGKLYYLTNKNNNIVLCLAHAKHEHTSTDEIILNTDRRIIYARECGKSDELVREVEAILSLGWDVSLEFSDLPKIAKKLFNLDRAMIKLSTNKYYIKIYLNYSKIIADFTVRNDDGRELHQIEIFERSEIQSVIEMFSNCELGIKENCLVIAGLGIIAIISAVPLLTI